MDLFEAIAKRRSYREGFKPTPVPREDLKKIVQAGLDAPSGCNAQTTRFLIVDDPKLLEQIGQMPTARQSLREAKALIVCIVDRKPEPTYADLAFQIEDCATAVENMLLAITALGYATVWLDGWIRREGRAELIGDLLGVPKEKVVRVLLPIGVPLHDVQGPEKLPFGARVWFNRYGAQS